MQGLLSIRGRSIIDDTDDTIEMTTKCIYRTRGDCAFIRYKETDASGFDGAVTTLEIEGDRKVTLSRSGRQNSQLIIEKGQRHICHYNTDAGELFIGVSADELSGNLTAQGGEFFFRYALDINTCLQSENEVHITVRRLEN